METMGDADRGSILPDSASSRIEDLLKQFISRAHELLETQERLRGLLSAVVSVAEDLELEAVLDRVVRSARDLVGAKYAAIGVLTPERTALSHFITIGISDDVIRQIGPPPTGHGVLGLLIRDPHPIRLHELGAHSDSYGFPPHHPPMNTFLGVPIRVRDEVFGNLYLTEKAGGEDFTAEDEDLVIALAAAAGVAIENARLFDATARRQRWLELSMEVAGRLLDADDFDDAVATVTECALGVADVSLAALVKPWGTSSEPSVGAIRGEDPGVFDDDGRAGAVVLAAEAVTSGKPVVRSGKDVFGPAGADILEVLAAPFGNGSQDQGALLLVRRAGAPSFSAVDVDMAPVYCSYASLALQVARAHRLREELVVLSDRDRIARDLHDVVIQRLFAAGLSLQGLRRFVPHGPAEEKIGKITSELDGTITALRSTIYSLSQARTGDSLTVRLVTAVQDGARSLASPPRIELLGPIDTGISSDIAEQALAVLTEAVSNVVRHADAQSMWVSASAVGGWFELVVSDDGKGLGEPTRRSGLKNASERADALGGEFEVVPGRDGGTQFRWAVPLTEVLASVSIAPLDGSER